VVVTTQATGIGTGIRDYRILGIGYTATDDVILREPMVHLRIRPVDVSELPVFGARPYKPDLPLLFNDFPF
jgi:hypothetical protein